MRDLYYKLNIPPTASKEEIKRAITSCPVQKLADDASYVLLNSKRKRVFDRCNKSLRRIGQLRAITNLKSGPNWTQRNVSDYNYETVDRQSIYDSIREEMAQKATKQQKSTSKGNETSDEADRRAIAWVFTIMFIIFILVASFGGNNSSVDDFDTNSASRSTTESKQEESLTNVFGEEESKNDVTPSLPKEPAFDKPAQPLPVNGYTYNYTSNKAIAPLEIKTPSSSKYHYFVKLEDYYTESLKFIIFIRAGRSVSVEVPLGTYSIKYATGKTWYGMKHLFGPGDMTSKFKADDVFRFENQGYQVTGYTIELIMQEFGNLDTRRLSDDEW